MRTPLVAVLAATALLTTGCSGQLPTSSAPRAGLPVSQQSEREVDRLLPPARPGAGPIEVVEGFLRASEGFAGDDDVSRSYLASELASSWVPTATVLIYEGDAELTLLSEDEVSVELDVVGRVDADGRLTEQARQSSTQTFGLTEVDGEPRISTFPDDAGLWLSDTAFERVFRPTVLSYLNTQEDVFVPELRWLADSEGLPTAVTRAQLAPLPAYLEGAVSTAANESVRLATPAVPVDPSTLVATVNLQGATLAQDETRAEGLSSQLAHSLLGLSSVAGVEVQASGQPLRLDGAEGPITAATELPYAEVDRQVSEVLLRVGEDLILVDPSQYALRDLDVPDDVALPQVELRWTGLAATDRLDDLAAVSVDGTAFRRWRGERVHTNEGIGDELTAPAVDPQGAFWVGGVHRSTQTPRVWVVDGAQLDAVARPVEADWLEDEDRVEAMSISPDGSRAALVVGPTTTEETEEPTVGRLLVSGIVRDSAGRPRELTTPLPVATTLRDVSAAHWSAAGELVVVGQRQDDLEPQAFRLALGGWLEPLGELPGLVDATPVPRVTGVDVIARTQDGGVYVPEGQRGWQPVRNGDQVVVPGG
ncbi:LpqB family beta-propeller domain-containing protein [uncultured Serinicoccus sp.]|uniref:LpqB family beta-propeller domain-containing protein n=1 Tax=uncultured Serinicoccus sp. TaxID=735514 RepID=UPI00261B32E8|nr:LpqB family beta-propeller domain-containing protein [uncultured Serinicoccus sp.]